MSVVSIEKCVNYEYNDILHAVEKTFENLGGIEKYIKPGMKVVLKPNLVMKKRPEEAATTHPTIVQAVAELAQKAGGRVAIADSPGGLYIESVLKGVYSVCGMKSVEEKTGAELNYNLDEIQVDNPDGKLLKKVTVIKPLVDADVVINLPKLKTHGQMVYTGAVKNMFGAVPGVLKAEYHLRMPDYIDFADALIDIFLSAKPTFNIMDAVTGMEGHGPTAGNPRNIGLVLASEDAFALDLTALSIIKTDPLLVPVIKQAMERGLVPNNLSDIRLVAELGNLQEKSALGINDFLIPELDALKAIQFYDRGILKYLMKSLRPKPVFKHDTCIGCFDCGRNCPARIIQMKDSKPVADMSRCIRCFCCQELCPVKAVTIKRPFLSKLFIKRVEKGK